MDNFWPEAGASVFGLILCICLATKYRDATEANRYYRELAYAVTLVTIVDVISVLFHIYMPPTYSRLFLFMSTLFYLCTERSSYCLLRYVAYRANRQNGRFFRAQKYIYFADVILILSNLTVPWLFRYGADGKVVYGAMHLPVTYGVALYFLLTACILQGVDKEIYTLLQRIVLRFAGAFMLIAFLIQFFILRNIYFSYAVGILSVYLIFFAVEAPVYRRVQELTDHLIATREEADEATRRAHQAASAKSNFLASTSHEIRTPMNAIMGINDLIARGTADEHIKEVSEEIRNAGINLLQIINDVLDYSRIESGKMELVEEVFSLSDVLMEVERTWLKRVESKQLQFQIVIDDKVPDEMFGDQDKIRQVLTNLVSNAVKYTDEGSVILHVRRIRRDGRDYLEMNVEDTGAGIREEEMEKLFTVFTRAALEENRNKPGAGLGLKISEELTHMMGGTIEVESEYGKGSRFMLYIPVDVTEAEEKARTLFWDKEEKRREEEDSISFAAPGRRVLIVDDTVVNLTVLRGMLRPTQMSVDEAMSGAEAIAMARNTRYDMVFLDHMMPEMDGIETLHALRKIPEYDKGEVCIVALTGNADETSRSFYLEKGFDDYLAKPMQERKLFQLLKKHLADYSTREGGI
ncbi:MAG: response regulator [Lachnospiraceae bacterium]|nr:response regulator [Lachnospiraceae bacterium]